MPPQSGLALVRAQLVLVRPALVVDLFELVDGDVLFWDVGVGWGLKLDLEALLEVGRGLLG